MSGNDDSTHVLPLGQILDGDEVIQQKSWQFVRQLNSRSDELLDAPALIGGNHTYTYRQMFRTWDRYAEVFSALGITGKNHARVVTFGSSSAEPILAIYALNMCGVSVSIIPLLDFLDTKNLERMVAEEGITDIVVPDFLMPKDLFCHLMTKRQHMGIRNIVILTTDLSGPFTPRFVTDYVRMQRETLRQLPGVQIMDDLLLRYAGYPIAYGMEPDDAAFIMHTSGTTKGIHKPVPLSDVGLNEAARRVLRRKEWHFLHHNLRTPVSMELGATYALVNMMHTPLVGGGTVVTLFLDSLNPSFPETIKHYDINVLLTASFVLDAMDACQADFSSVEVVFVGGAYVSPVAKRRYDAILKRFGAKAGVSIGYGLSEAGGANIVASADRTDDAMGYPLPGVRVKIFDEDEDVFYDLEDGPRTGVLFINSPSVSSGRIGNKTYFTIDEVDGEPYLNTFDLVRVNEDGSLTHAGRMNRYFVNNDGIRFDAGLVEGAISAQPQIRACAIAPHYDKTIHDTVPVLYAQVDGPSTAGASMVHDALVKVFVADDAIQKTNLPAQCVIVDAIPRNATGKVDVHAVRSSRRGACFQVSPVRVDNRLVDVRLDRVSGDGMLLQNGIPDELDSMELTYAQMLLWFIPGAHAWYTTGNTERKKKALEKGARFMTQFAQQMNQPQFPQGVPFPMAQMPPAMGPGQAVPIMPYLQNPVPAQPAFPFPIPPAQAGPSFPFLLPIPFPVPATPDGQQAQDSQAPQAMASAPFMPFPPFNQQAPTAQMPQPPFNQQAPGTQPPQPPQMPFAPFGQAASTAQMPQPPCGQQTPFGQAAPGAQMPQIPFAPFGQAAAQAPTAQPMAFPYFPMPFPTQAAPGAQPAPGAQAAPGVPQPVQTPFVPAPQPYEVYERALKNAINFLQNMLAQSEAARAAANATAPAQANDADNKTDAADKTDAAEGGAGEKDAQGAAPAAFMPGFGCQQVPVPQQPTQQQAPGAGILPTNNYLGSLFGSFFGATNTDYFYED